MPNSNNTTDLGKDSISDLSVTVSNTPSPAPSSDEGADDRSHVLPIYTFQKSIRRLTPPIEQINISDSRLGTSIQHQIGNPPLADSHLHP